MDQFQGMERDVVILSLVLNGPRARLSPFLKTPERINVAMSRARRLLVIVGSRHNYVRMAGADSHYGVFFDQARKAKGVLQVGDVLAV